MKIFFDPEGSLAGFKRLISEISNDCEANGFLILACDGNGFCKEEIDPLLASIAIPVIGGIFPAIFHNGQVFDHATLVAALSSPLQVQVIPTLDCNFSEFVDTIDEKLLFTEQTKTMFVLVDGLSFKINILLDALFDAFGLEINYIGGGAGSLSLQRKPCLFTNHGLVMNSAILATMDRFCGIGVGHGLKTVSGPHRLTETKDNIVYSIDWKPAYQFLKATASAFLEEGEDDHFPLVSRYFSLGLNRLDEEKVVREAALAGENDSLIFSTEMPQNALIDILKSNPDSMIKSACKAKDDAKASLSSRTIGTTIVFDCCCRRMFLQERFAEEIMAIYDHKAPMIGVLTIGGEIANTGRSFLEYYNRTCVIGLLEQ